MEDMYREIAEKNDRIIKILDCWLQLKQDGKSLYQFFEKNGYYHIAIYGLGILGNRLVDELNRTDVDVVYVIDQAISIHTLYDTYRIEDDLPSADAIIVTPVFHFHQIKEELEKKVDCPIISLEKIFYEII